MTASEIIAIANELQCGPDQSAIRFVRMIAEHCAQIADETAGCGPAAIAIREAFRI